MIEDLPNHEDWLYLMGIEVHWADTDGIQEAISILDPPTMLLRRRQSRREERWAVFHALAHLRLHRGNQLYYHLNGRSAEVAKQERQAEEWTADLLIPRGDLLDFVIQGVSEDELADIFDVPQEAVKLAISLLSRY